MFLLGLIYIGALFIVMALVSLWPSDDFWNKNKFLTNKKIFFSTYSFALGLILIGQAMCFMGISSIYTNLKVKNWTQIPAVVIEASLQEESLNQHKIYIPKVTYEYNYQNEIHRASRIKFGNFDNDNKLILEELLKNKFFVGNTIDIWVNPKSPKEAVVDPVGDNEYDFIIILLGTLISGMGAFMIIGTKKHN